MGMFFNRSPKVSIFHFPPPFTTSSSFLFPFSLLSSLSLSLSLHLRLKMEDQTALPVDNGPSVNGDRRNVLDIYPLSCYYFGSTQAISFKDETLADRLQRMKSNYAAHGMRTCVEAVILVELFKHPHLLLLQSRNSVFKLPGGRLRPGESEVDCLKRKLGSKLFANEEGGGPDWEVGECLGMWWRPDFKTLIYPYLPPNVKNPKECTRLFLVKLPASRKFIVPTNFKLLAVPLCEIHENHKTYGPIISGVPQLLSRFSFNIIDA